MSRRAVALMALIVFATTSGMALAALPKVKPKTGTFTGKGVDSKNPGVLHVTKKGRAYGVASLKLVFHIDCEDANGAASERDAPPVTVSGKFHKATVTTDQNKFVRSYKFKTKKQTEAGPGSPSVFYNIEAEVTAAKNVRVVGLYTEQVNDESGETVSSCESGTESWRLSHR
jgi:hypothetical protein